MGYEIVAQDLFRTYNAGDDEVQALRGLSIKVANGQLVSIIGPSGSGKTTLLNVLGGLDKPTGGRAWIRNEEVTKMVPRELLKFRLRNIGHVLQTNNLLPYLTAEENIELPMIAAGTPLVTRRNRVKYLLGSVGLTRRAAHRPDQLSGGERQRVSIASALANDPAVLLADEPTGELDTANARSIVDLLGTICRNGRKTVVLVTHDPKVAQAADIIHLIEDGMIAGSMTPSRVLLGNPLYVEGLKTRIAEIDRQIETLDSAFRERAKTPEEFAKERHELQQARSGLKSELHKHGVID